MSITLNDLDPTHNTLAYVHGDKDRVVPSLVGIEDGAGTYNLAASAAEFKGRGNYTWGLPKKPYQIKFNSWTAILGMPKAKAWVLLANDADGSLMRNKLAFDYALAIGSPYAPESRWVDLVVNGQYLGNYLVAEKV
ncbi:MAG TPA: CotH kinase family protein, partial [Dermatophilaceae bacterium]|nr:CotH kinase family protein [Dermatophilaceae bacterium]